MPLRMWTKRAASSTTPNASLDSSSLISAYLFPTIAVVLLLVSGIVIHRALVIRRRYRRRMEDLAILRYRHRIQTPAHKIKPILHEIRAPTPEEKVTDVSWDDENLLPLSARLILAPPKDPKSIFHPDPRPRSPSRTRHRNSKAPSKSSPWIPFTRTLSHQETLPVEEPVETDQLQIHFLISMPKPHEPSISKEVDDEETPADFEQYVFGTMEIPWADGPLALFEPPAVPVRGRTR